MLPECFDALFQLQSMIARLCRRQQFFEQLQNDTLLIGHASPPFFLAHRANAALRA